MINRQTHDNKGREYAKLSELKVGDKIELDNNFTCTDATFLTVAQGASVLCFPCEEGEHNLHSQADDGDHLIGIYKSRRVVHRSVPRSAGGRHDALPHHA